MRFCCASSTCSTIGAFTSPILSDLQSYFKSYFTMAGDINLHIAELSSALNGLLDWERSQDQPRALLPWSGLAGLGRPESKQANKSRDSRQNRVSNPGGVIAGLVIQALKQSTWDVPDDFRKDGLGREGEAALNPQPGRRGAGETHD